MYGRTEASSVQTDTGLLIIHGGVGPSGIIGQTVTFNVSFERGVHGYVIETIYIP